jgi:aminoglycoside 6'-N-acetyltransferase I
MRVRPFAASDRAELERLYRLLFPDAEVALEVDQLVVHLPDERAVFVAARGDGRLGGFVEAGWRSYAEGCDGSPAPYVEAWYVDADLRRGGVGGALIAAVEEWARAHGASELASDALIENEVSIAAHKRLGFVELERVVCFRKVIGAAGGGPDTR